MYVRIIKIMHVALQLHVRRLITYIYMYLEFKDVPTYVCTYIAQ